MGVGSVADLAKGEKFPQNPWVMRSLLRDFLLLACLVLGPPTQVQAQGVRIAAASDLRWALEELKAGFLKEHSGMPVAITYGSSGNFHTQLTQKAPFDLFLSADVAYPRELAAQGFGVKKSLFVYGTGRIVLWVPRASPIAVEALGYGALLAPAVKKIALANPRHAPYGRAAEAALRKAGLLDRVQARLVLGENISQAAQFVESGAADIGFIAQSLVVAGPLKDKGRWWLVPERDHPAIEQGGVILSWAQDPVAAAAFRDYLLGGKGTAILKTYGFIRREP